MRFVPFPNNLKASNCTKYFIDLNLFRRKKPAIVIQFSPMLFLRKKTLNLRPEALKLLSFFFFFFQNNTPTDLWSLFRKKTASILPFFLLLFFLRESFNYTFSFSPLIAKKRDFSRTSRSPGNVAKLDKKKKIARDTTTYTYLTSFSFFFLLSFLFIHLFKNQQKSRTSQRIWIIITHKINKTLAPSGHYLQLFFHL